MIWTYENVRRALNGDDERTFPNLAATRFTRGEAGVFHLEYHGSRIVTYHPDGTYTLDTCGYATKTTKARIGKFGPCDVIQKKGEWFILNSSGLTPLYDGMRVDSYGDIVEDESMDELWIEADTSPENEDETDESAIDNRIRKEFL